ncbi:carboxylesterase [Aerococcus urinaeequi]|uniref:carboxylesterase family protein n=1 Tax=Aerococcus urinaeequi TaxID=51665 RepID=UPI000744B250|nr:carboxylesterase family protein [Aerococcus urinaeequi]ALZ87052.1 carboxylesterase [Aerococcus urinaeequi]
MKNLNWVVLVTTFLTLAGCNQQNSTESNATDVTSENIASSETLASDLLIRETQFGSVMGYEEDEALIWQGIPYGGDTSGENRWQAPTDPQPWSETLDATQAGVVALQAGADGVTGSEDALNLDIYRPNNETEDLPVLVYIHGGNNQTGQAQEISGKSFVSSQDAIVVSVNYRLGPLGFNPLPALKTGSDEENSGNYAMLDLAKSLDWIRANIGEFGGDSNNITVSGFSAGGRDVMAMLISPLFEGKFDKAISFSGGMTIADEEKSQDIFAESIAPLVVEDGVKNDEDQAKKWLLTSDEEVKDYLYNLDGIRLVGLMSNAGIRMDVFPHLYNDGTVIPTEGFDTETYNSVPLIMLTGEQEFSLFSRFDPYFAEAVSDGSIDTDQDISGQYDFVNKYGGQLYSLFNLEDSAIKMTSNYNAPIYGMEILFGENPDYISEEMAKIGSFHGVFVPLLDTDSESYAELVTDSYESQGAKELSVMFQNYIYEFISSGNPNGENLTEWTEWQKDADENILFLDADDSVAIAKMGKKEFDYASVLAAIENDRSITEEQKADLLSEVMNGRWFSYELDKKYHNLSEYDQ